MRNEADRARGLMFRRSMAADHGMLFDFERVEPVAMWMKNTYLPLDMLFLRADGTVARIAADTEPLSTRTIPSGEPVLGVLELNAGTAARLGLRAATGSSTRCSAGGDTVLGRSVRNRITSPRGV